MNTKQCPIAWHRVWSMLSCHLDYTHCALLWWTLCLLINLDHGCFIEGKWYNSNSKVTTLIFDQWYLAISWKDNNFNYVHNYCKHACHCENILHLFFSVFRELELYYLYSKMWDNYSFVTWKGGHDINSMMSWVWPQLHPFLNN